MSLLHSCHVDVDIVFISPDLLAFELVEYPEGASSVRRWKKVFGESLSFASVVLAHNIVFTYIPVLLLVILYSIIFIKLKTQVHPVEQSTNNQQQRKRRNRNVLQMSIAIVTVGTWCVIEWKKAFGESSSFASFVLAYYILFIYIPVPLLVILYSIIVIKLKTQAHPGEQSANTQQQRNRRNRNVLQMSIAIVTVFVFCWLPYSSTF